MTPWLDDGDVTLFHGDALETVRQMPDESVDCVVTSPPYWGLRDYGTAEWVDGDPECDHQQQRTTYNQGFNERWGQGAGQRKQETKSDRQYPRVCAKCGAVRIDAQRGLEPTPDLFVRGMVELFREIRRVLAPHGTCWVNLGDSYNSAASNQRNELIGGWNAGMGRSSTLAPDLKPKDLVGIPWRVAFALQADGWYLRSDIIWAKPNPMPESVTDRPTKSHEYVFLLTKRPRYWFDTEAVRETWADERNGASGSTASKYAHPGAMRQDGGVTQPPQVSGRNVRSVWQIATQPYPEAHFATFPEELARRCIVAGCPTRVCRVCGKPSERIVERGDLVGRTTNDGRGYVLPKADGGKLEGRRSPYPPATDTYRPNARREIETVGWSDCGHNQWRPGRVLDPFMGSGTTAKVARDHQRHAIGIDLSSEYLELAARRLQQLSLLT